MYPPIGRMLKRPPGLILTSMAVVVWGLWPLLAPKQLNPASQYDCRFLDLLVPFALMPLAVMLAIRPKWFAGRIADLVRLAAIMLIAQSLWHLSATYQWWNYLHDCKTSLATKSGPIHIPADNGFNNSSLSWNNPTMSLMIGPSQVQAIIMADSTAWQPFNPLNPQSLPDLQRYGLDYSKYIDTLQRNKAIHE